MGPDGPVCRSPPAVDSQPQHHRHGSRGLQESCVHAGWRAEGAAGPRPERQRPGQWAPSRQPHARAADSSAEPGGLPTTQSASILSPQGRPVCDTVGSCMCPRGVLPIPPLNSAMPQVSAPRRSLHHHLGDAPGTGLDPQNPCSPCSQLSQCRVTRTGLWWPCSPELRQLRHAQRAKSTPGGPRSGVPQACPPACRRRLPCPHMVVPVCMSVSVSSPHGDTDPNGPGPPG